MNHMNRYEIAQKLNRAIESFRAHDEFLLQQIANERAIAHRLAVHLEMQFPEYHVDCEYNRNPLIGHAESKEMRGLTGTQRDNILKLIRERKEEIAGTLEALAKGVDFWQLPIVQEKMGDISVNPDIIVHRRGTNKNILVIEIKKDVNPDTYDFDDFKLQNFTEAEGYAYELGVFLEVPTGNHSIQKPFNTTYYLKDRVRKSSIEDLK